MFAILLKSFIHLPIIAPHKYCHVNGKKIKKNFGEAKKD